MYDCYVNMNKCNAERWKRAEDTTLVARYSAHMHMCNRNTSKLDLGAYLINKCTCEDFEKRMAKFSFHLHLSLSLSVSFSLSVGLTTKSISWMRKSSGKVEAHKNIDTRHSIWFGRCEYAKERPVRRCHVESLTYLCTKDKDYYPFSALIFWHTSCEPLKDFE